MAVLGERSVNEYSRKARRSSVLDGRGKQARAAKLNERQPINRRRHDATEALSLTERRPLALL